MHNTQNCYEETLSSIIHSDENIKLNIDDVQDFPFSEIRTFKAQNDIDLNSFSGSMKKAFQLAENNY